MSTHVCSHQFIFHVKGNVRTILIVVYMKGNCKGSLNLIGLDTYLFVCNRGDTMQYWTRMNYGTILHLSMLTTDNTTQYHDRHLIKGVMPSPMLLVYLTPRGALSSHPQLYWLQDRDSMPNSYTINHLTTLHTHNETQWPTAARRWHFALQDV